jgi:glycosyltransferase involved in cell wall biosynthesis
MRISCVHQGYELYGSDRCFIESVAAIRAAWPDADIEVVLPREGPIVAHLRAVASRVVFEPIFVARRRDIVKLLSTGAPRLIAAFWRAMRRFRNSDLVYVNTIVILDYLLAARFFPDKSLVHVHEIPDGPAFDVFRALLRFSRSELIFNSKATRAAFDLPGPRPQHVVYNGVAGPRAATMRPYDGTRPLHLLMIGRINRSKGQDVLIEALAQLPRVTLERLEVRIVGGSFGDDTGREAALRERVRTAGLGSVVSFKPFRDDPAPLYQWADVVTVPSRLSESLGRVAIEAMAFGRPPLVSALGGLVEVVEDRVTGWTVPPNDPGALARRIAEIVTRPDDWRRFPAAARARYEAMFESRAVAQQIQSIVGARLMANAAERQMAELAHG